MNDEMIEKLETKLAASTGIEKAEILETLANTLSRKEPDKALSYANEALLISKKLNNLAHQAKSRISIGHIYFRKGGHAQSLKQYKEALGLLREFNDRQGQAYCLSNIGNIYFYIQDFQGALESYLEAMDINKELENKKDIASLTNNISNVYIKMQNYEKALEFANQSLNLKIQIGEENSVAAAYHTIGTIYQKMESIEDALENFNQALKLREKIDNKIGISKTLIHIAEVYLAYGDSSRALEMAKRAYELSYQLRRTKQVIECMVILGEIYLKFGDSDVAESHLTNALMQAQRIKSIEIAARVHKLLSRVYSSQNKQFKAMEHSDKYTQLFEKLQRKQLDETVSKIDRYNREKEKIDDANIDNEKIQRMEKQISEKDSQIAALKKQLQQSSQSPEEISIMRSIIDSISDIIIFRSAKDQAMIYNTAAENIIPKEFEETENAISDFYQDIINDRQSDRIEKIETKHGINGEIYRFTLDEERCWVFKVRTNRNDAGNIIWAKDISEFWAIFEILDDQKQTLNKNIKDLEHRNNSLKEILFHIEEEKVNHKKKIGDKIFRTVVPTMKQIQNELDDAEFKNDSDQKDIVELINNLQDDFSSIFMHSGNIQEIYANLSSREIEVSNLIRNGLSSKQIAEKLGISSATVNRHRNRIRQKLGLVDKKQSLKNYLRSDM
ncbi:MAG: tetratricopeptide repeat protein [Candidatus Zixiibacteriota bacterium]